jgi:hypothetical protein
LVTVGRIAREPLLHFLLIGLALFLYYGHAATGSSDDRRIVVSQTLVDDLVRQFQATWSRWPTAQEQSSLVDGYVRDEILYREGKALGLDRDDTLIKRRVRQKLEVMAEEDSEHNAPTDTELGAYLNAHPEKFLRPAVVTFEQIYFGPPTPRSESRIDAAKSLLLGGGSWSALGEPSMLPHRIDMTDIDVVARDFGLAFATALATLPVGHWAGPVRSGLGVHLVRVDGWAPRALPLLDAVRSELRREWEYDRRKRELESNYEKVRANYDVVIQAKLAGGE